MELKVNSIGEIHNSEERPFIEIAEAWRPALRALEGFSHVNVLWWFSLCDDSRNRSILQIDQPYKGAPLKMGTFATRSPSRPNPIAFTVCEITHLDLKNGRIFVTFIDAEEGSPVLDIKPYTPSLDRVENPRVPVWCAHWPRSTEESGCFDWGRVFNF